MGLECSTLGFMKNLITLLVALLPFCVTAQENFRWDIRDSNTLSKDDIYSKAKQFIAETWNEPSQVIKNDDKESGMILLRGLTTEAKTHQMNLHEFTFQYQMKFQMREGEWRLVIEDVVCESHWVGANKWRVIEVSDSFPGKGKSANMNAQRYGEVMAGLKQSLQDIADDYVKAMNESPASDDW